MPFLQVILLLIPPPFAHQSRLSPDSWDCIRALRLISQEFYSVAKVGIESIQRCRHDCNAQKKFIVNQSQGCATLRCVASRAKPAVSKRRAKNLRAGFIVPTAWCDSMDLHAAVAVSSRLADSLTSRSSSWSWGRPLLSLTPAHDKTPDSSNRV